MDSSFNFHQELHIMLLQPMRLLTRLGGAQKGVQIEVGFFHQYGNLYIEYHVEEVEELIAA